MNNLVVRLQSHQLAITLMAMLTCMASPSLTSAQTPLDDYVAAPDASYSYEVQTTDSRPGYTVHRLGMTSQTWRTSEEVVDEPSWIHAMQIIEPDRVEHGTALLNIRRNLSSVSSLANIATATGSIVVEINPVPKRQIHFAGERFSRDEDQALAKSWRQFLDGGDSQWSLFLPMTKSAVRAMDTVQDWMGKQSVSIDNFVVSGHSKRGWTSWLTAAVDDRVSAIIPLAADFLNFDEQMRLHRQAYADVTENLFGGYSASLRKYASEGVLDELSTPRGQELLSIMDPFEYRDRIEIPKFLVHATGDGFSVPDSSQLYFQDLIGPKYQRYVPNTRHFDVSIFDLAGLPEYFNAVVTGATLPKFSWQLADDGRTIRVDTADTPIDVKLWQATNPESRDFRHSTVGAIWSSSDLKEVDLGQYSAQITRPESGATAFMIELIYDVGGNNLTFTTDISVVRAVPEPAVSPLALLTCAGLVRARGRRCR